MRCWGPNQSIPSHPRSLSAGCIPSSLAEPIPSITSHPIPSHAHPPIHVGPVWPGGARVLARRSRPRRGATASNGFCTPTSQRGTLHSALHPPACSLPGHSSRPKAITPLVMPSGWREGPDQMSCVSALVVGLIWQSMQCNCRPAWVRCSRGQHCRPDARAAASEPRSWTAARCSPCHRYGAPCHPYGLWEIRLDPRFRNNSNGTAPSGPRLNTQRRARHGAPVGGCGAPN